MFVQPILESIGGGRVHYVYRQAIPEIDNSVSKEVCSNIQFAFFLSNLESMVSGGGVLV